MKKLILASSLIAAFGSAHADVGLYGLVDMSYGKAINTSADGLKADIHSGGDGGNNEGNSVTRFGIKGTTDVGSGVKANFKLESNGITSGGVVNSPFFGRKAYAGLSGSFGEVRVGRQDSVPFQAMIDFDLNGASNGVSAFFYAQTAPWGTNRQDRSVQYIAPEMGGLKLQAGFVPEGNVAGEKATFSLAGTYTMGKLTVAAAGETKRTTTGSNFSSVAGSYDFGTAKVIAAYATGGRGATASGASAKGLSLGGQVTLAGTNVGLQLGKNTDTKATAYELFANREVFKSTYAYVEAGTLDNKGKPVPFTGSASPKTKATGYAVGVIYVF
jgi:predicted porin